MIDIECAFLNNLTLYRKEKELPLFMLCISDCKLLGCNEREGKNGTYYQVTLLFDDEPKQLLANKDIYEVAKCLEFGTERRALLDVRQYGRDWGVRVVDLLSYEDE